VALTAFAGCGSNGNSADSATETTAVQPPTPEADETGSLSFALSTPDGVTFDSFDYVIVGPGVQKTGKVDVSNSTTVSTLVDGLPPAASYTVTLSGSSAPPDNANCSGSAQFSINAGETTDVPVPVRCHLDGAGAPVPVPPLATVALGLALFAAGARQRRQRA
jgi:hypothetical protein